MASVLPVFLALLLLVSVPGFVVADVSPSSTSDMHSAPTNAYSAVSDPVPVEGLNTTERLELDPAHNVTSGFAEPSLDLGASLQSDGNQLTSRYQNYQLDEQFVEAGSDDERRSLLERTMRELNTEIEDVRTAERAAYIAYHNGRMSADELVTQLILIQVRAETIADQASFVSTLSGDISGFSVEREVRTVQLEASIHSGPVRDHVSTSLYQTGTSTRVYVQASEHGYVLSTIDGSEFVREAYRVDNRDLTTSRTFGSISAAGDRAIELYPWTFSQASGYDGDMPRDVFRVRANHAHGTLTTYLDGATEAAFRENHHIRLTDFPSATASSVTETDLHVEVHRTFPGGPARVTVQHATSDEPVSGVDISVDGMVVGQTDDDGELWTLAPRDQYEVAVEHQHEIVSVTVNDVEQVVANSTPSTGNESIYDDPRGFDE